MPIIKAIFAINMRPILTFLIYKLICCTNMSRNCECDATVPLDGLHFLSDGNCYWFVQECQINWNDFHSYGVVDSQLDVSRQRNQTYNAVLKCNKVWTLKVLRELLRSDVSTSLIFVCDKTPSWIEQSLNSLTVTILLASRSHMYIPVLRVMLDFTSVSCLIFNVPFC
jgi:hypothetical protein